MSEHRKQIRYHIIAFLFLFTVSLYRQISLRWWPQDPARTYVLYACYVILIAVWIRSVLIRVTQQSMRFFLTAEALVMLTGLTIRFLQDTFWTQDILLMRVSGFCVGATILPMLLLGLYASFGIGQADQFRLPRGWYLLAVPVAVMTALFVTDERRHFICYIIPEEPQPNLAFHPYIGTLLMLVLGLVLMLLRIFVIMRRNRIMDQHPVLRRLLPVLEPLLMLLVSFAFFMVSWQLIPALAGKEVIELYAKIYYVEVLTWECYIATGLVPVNTRYREIFEHATVGMQILTQDGGRIASKAALPVSDEELVQLESKGTCFYEPDKQMYLHRFAEGTLLWHEDVSAMRSVIGRLSESSQTLTQESALLQEEIKTKNQEERVLAKNQIYDELTGDVKGQLHLMKELSAKGGRGEQSDRELLCRLMLLGTYVKRRCNLRLIEKETGVIDAADLQLSFTDMAEAMRRAGIRTDVSWDHPGAFLPDEAILLFDFLEELLEYQHFEAERFTIEAKDDGMAFTVRTAQRMPAAGSFGPAQPCNVTWQQEPGEYQAQVRITRCSEQEVSAIIIPE